MKFDEIINNILKEETSREDRIKTLKTLKSVGPDLQQILDSDELSDKYEEDAEDFLDKKDVELSSHSRAHILKLAWKHGWRP